KARFEEIFRRGNADGVRVEAKRIGERPCMGSVDPEAQERLASLCETIVSRRSGVATRRISSSTDCNVPLSLGIPAVCISACDGGGMHTRDEFLVKESLPKGLEIAIETALTLAKE
ncbi:MAG: peptidase, partial [Clostridia bacterium]|nr:peptidase [Clostridia bacterium]